MAGGVANRLVWLGVVLTVGVCMTALPHTAMAMGVTDEGDVVGGSETEALTNAATPESSYEGRVTDEGTDAFAAPAFYNSPAHELTEAERSYEPEHQLDALEQDTAREKQAAELERFSQRLDTRVLAAQAARLDARTSAVAADTDGAAERGSASGVVTPLTGEASIQRTEEAPNGDMPDAPRFAAQNTAATVAKAAPKKDKDGWLSSMRMQSVRAGQKHSAALAAAHATKQKAAAKAKQRQRQRHRQRQHQRQRSSVSDRVRARVRARARAREGDDEDGGDAEDEKYMATDEAKGQEAEYEPDESSNFWWWDYWSPYVA